MKQFMKSAQSCDVLVVGGGAAALVAALEAKKQGMDVLIVSKGRIGRSGNTIVAGSGFSAYVSFPGTTDSEELFFEDTMSGGKGINDENLVELLVRNSALAITELKDWLIISPTVHFFMGGIKIDQDCMSEVPGLFAAGEVCGGIHGANRLSGNALTETIVFGKIAGKKAAEFARKTHQLIHCGWELEAPEGTGHEKVTNIRRVLREVMWQDVSIVRTQESLQRASEQLRACRQALNDLNFPNLQDLANYAETEKMIIVAQAVVMAATERRESRGSHFRIDYPGQDDSRWMGGAAVKAENLME